MLYIMTIRGWQPLHKAHYGIAKSWREAGLDVEEKVANLKPHEFWVSEYIYNSWEVRKRLVYGARQRAKKDSREFSISESDFEIPKVCPLRRVPFQIGIGQHTDDSPTLDRKDPRLGYVKGNVWVISHKANRLKGDFTPDELRAFCENVLGLDWITWTSDDENAMRRREAEKQKERWWALWGSRGPK